MAEQVLHTSAGQPRALRAFRVADDEYLLAAVHSHNHVHTHARAAGDGFDGDAARSTARDAAGLRGGDAADANSRGSTGRLRVLSEMNGAASRLSAMMLMVRTESSSDGRASRVPALPRLVAACTHTYTVDGGDGIGAPVSYPVTAATIDRIGATPVYVTSGAGRLSVHVLSHADAWTFAHVCTHTHDRRHTAVCMHDTNEWIAAGDDRGCVSVFDLRAGLQGHSALFGAADEGVCVHTCAHVHALTPWRGHDHSVLAASPALSCDDLSSVLSLTCVPEDPYGVMAGTDAGRVVCWDMRRPDREVEMQVVSHADEPRRRQAAPAIDDARGPIWDLAFIPRGSAMSRGHTLLSAAEDGAVHSQCIASRTDAVCNVDAPVLLGQAALPASHVAAAEGGVVAFATTGGSIHTRIVDGGDRSGGLIY